MRKIILATTTSFDSYIQGVSHLLQRYNLRLIENPYKRKLSEAELYDLLEKYRPVGLLAGLEPITYGLLQKAKVYLRVISRVGAGWDNIDKKSAAKCGILVYRTQGVLTQSVAELTIGMILVALRHIANQDRQIRTNQWQKKMGNLFQGKVLGIIGFGAIGQRVGEIAKVFGAEVLFFDPQVIYAPWAQPESLENILKLADIITLHASGNREILGDEELHDRCKQGVIIVNTARGGLINEQSLARCLKSGKVAYACLDVFEEEPYHGELRDMENVIMTPHIGSYAIEARRQMELMAVENVINGLRETGVLESEII